MDEVESFALTAVAAIDRAVFSRRPAPHRRLVVHVLGGDASREGNDIVWTRLSEAVAARGLTVRIVVVGPAMAPRSSGLVEYVRSLYHDWCGEEPDLVLMFHPGLWGYEDWRPTIDLVLGRAAPVVVTSYNIEEAELDARAIAAVLDGAPPDDDAELDYEDWLWPPESNNNCSPNVRPTATAPPGTHEYRENAVWQCVQPKR